MSVIKITVDEQNLHITDSPKVAAQGVNENYVEFTFSEDWSGFGKVALFYREEDEDTVYESAIGGNGRALVPHEVTDQRGKICIGVAGVKDDVIHTSEILKYRVVKGLYTAGESSQPPTPGMYEQMLELAGQMAGQFEEAVVEQNQIISGLRSDQAALRTELEADQETFEDVITGRMDTFIASQSGDYKRVTLWTSPDANGIIAGDTTVTLSEAVENFDYVEIYGMNTDNDAVETIPVDEVLADPGYAVRSVNISATSIKLRVVESRITISGTTFTIANQYLYGDTDATTVRQITQANKGTWVGQFGIMKIVGRKLVENAEVTDIRVGADGIVYQTAGTAVRNQLAKKVNAPLSSGSVDNGTAGQVLKTNGNGSTYWSDETEGSGSGLTQTEKDLILTLFSKAAYADNDAADAYSQLETLWDDSSFSVSWSGIGYTKGNSAAVVEAGNTFTSTVMANTGFTISNVVVNMGGVTVQGAWSGGTVTIPNVTGDIVITVTTSQITVSSISASYTQSGTVYDTDSLDSLKSDLVVTATFIDSSTGVIEASDYTLSGALAEGTSTITVSYADKTATFNVTVTHYTPQINYLYNWDFTQSLIDSVNSAEANLAHTSVGTADPTRTSLGVQFDGANQICYLGDFGSGYFVNKTVELDIASFNGAIGVSTQHYRLFMLPPTSTKGTGPLIYQKDTGWSAYVGNSWSSVYGSAVSGNTSDVLNYFSGKTVKLVFDTSGYCSLYVNNAFIGTSTIVFTGESARYAYLGGISGGASYCYNMTVSGVRIYANS